VLDNGRSRDRYLAVFDDGAVLTIGEDGGRSAWWDDHLNFDPWTLAARVAYGDLPLAIQEEILRRADELDDALRGNE
jgi:hypothetical protein